MRTRKVFAIVARAVNYRESDRILTLLTPDCGKLTVTARGARRQKSPLLACAQPFCYGEFLLTPFMGKWALSQCDLRESFYELRLDYPKLEAAAAALSAACDAIQEEEPAPDVFFLTYYALTYLAYGESPAVDLMICFYIKLMNAMGYSPATTRCARCGESTFEGAGFNVDVGALCARCSTSVACVPVAALTLEAMRRMLKLPAKEIGKVVLPNDVREELCTVLPEYCANHAGLRLKTGELLTSLKKADDLSNT